MADDGSYDALDKAVSDIAEDGLAKYLMDADLPRGAVHYLHDELGIPKPAGRLLVRGIAQLAELSTKGAGSHADGIVKARLRRLPHFDQLEKGLDGLTAYLKGELRIAAGKTRPRHDQDFAGLLTESLRDSLEGVAAAANLRDAAAQLIAESTPQPKLFLNLFDAGSQEDLNRFHYSTRKTPFVGRENEMARLDGFLDHDSPFRWWLIHGPAGCGKSRLALELCLRRGGSWRVGFLPCEHTAQDVDGWIPDEPILLVADYASGRERAKELGRTIRDLSGRAGEFAFPVRLLLIERDAGDWWLDRLRESAGGRPEADKSRHEEPMALGGLTEGVLRRVMQACGLAETWMAELLPALREMDPEGRPLFAALMADAVAGGRPPSQFWQADGELIGGVLVREEERFWKPAGITNADKDLLALATLCGGVGLGDLSALPEGPGLLEGHDASRYRLMSSRDASERLAPLEPDILGEWFVLHHLQPGDVPGKRLEGMRELAWRMAPRGMAVFLDRTSRDFPHHDAFQAIATAPAEGSLAAVVLWARVTVNLIGRFAAPDPDAAARWYGDIQALAAKHPEEGALREQQTKAANNLISSLAASDPEAAARWYGDIQALAANHPKEEMLRESQVRAATNLIFRLAASDPDAAARWYGDIKTLAANHPKEKALRESQARAANNLINRLAASDPDTAVRWYGDILTLTTKHSEEAALRETQAKAATNLIYHLAAPDPDEAARWYGDIQALAGNHPEEKALLEHQSKAAFNLFLACVKAGAMAGAKQMAQGILRLAAENPGLPVCRDAAERLAPILKSGEGK
jgi:hypothetical protein